MARKRTTKHRGSRQAGAGAKAHRRSRAPAREAVAPDPAPLALDPIDHRCDLPELPASSLVASRPAEFARLRMVFLACIANGWTHRHALRHTGLQWDWINRERQTDAAFKTAYDAAVVSGREFNSTQLEDEGYRRALFGREQGVYFEGKRVGTERVPSDRLLERMLQSRPDGDKFAERISLKTIDAPPAPTSMAEWEALAERQRQRKAQS